MQLDWGSLRQLADRAEAGATASWAPLMQAMLEVLDRLPQPAVGRRALDVAADQWRRCHLEPAALEAERVNVWNYLSEKNGGSWAMVDDEDRALRAVLCVLHTPESTATACDTVDFFVDVLRPVRE